MTASDRVFCICHFLVTLTCFGNVIVIVSFLIAKEGERERECVCMYVCVCGGVTPICISNGFQSFYIDKSIKLIYIPVQRAPGYQSIDIKKTIC